MIFPTMWYVRPAKAQTSCAYAQSDQSICLSLEYSMTGKLLTEHHLKVLSLKGAAQACLSLHLSRCHIVGNLISRLNYNKQAEKHSSLSY